MANIGSRRGIDALSGGGGAWSTERERIPQSCQLPAR